MDTKQQRFEDAPQVELSDEVVQAPVQRQMQVQMITEPREPSRFPQGEFVDAIDDAHVMKQVEFL